MKRDTYHILMADIVQSRDQDQQLLMLDFKALVSEINLKEAKQLLSPLTITLGDEFQGVLTGLPAAMSIIIALEEAIVRRDASFKLRYVLVEGEIDTPINPKMAYEMLGSGLTQAREQLGILKSSTARFFIQLNNLELARALTNAFAVFQGIHDDWNIQKDYYLVAKFLELHDYKAVAEALGKDRSLMWKREKSLKIQSYTAIRDIIRYLGQSI